ncbi:MAG TPA: ATP-binding protein [Dehalococcoidia bacterium]|nr:ATP-binding protein [Dehalococcoidia bacterium]
MTEAGLTALHDVFPGDSNMARLMREADWEATALGPAHLWPQSLKSAVSILLSSKAEIVLFWGPDLVALYNDSYAPTFGSKHPWALGKPARECWSEVWDVIGPLFQNVMSSGESFWAKSYPFLLHRHGYLEETYYDVSYDPVRAEGGAIGGVFCIVSDKTGEVIGERRLRLLREIAAAASNLRSPLDACRKAASVLEQHNHDVPFAMFYELKGDSVHFVAGSSIEAGTAASPIEVQIDDADWLPVQRAVKTGKPDVLRHLSERFARLPRGPWDVATDAAVVLPLHAATLPGAPPWGLLIAGVSPRRELDDDYENFLTLVAGQAGSAIASAQAYDEERRRAEALDELNRAKTLFFSNVSHEFRTPLTLMMGPLEDLLTSRVLESSPAEANVETAYRNSLRLLRLVNTLLDFSRIESGRIDAVYEQTDLAELTRDIAGSFSSAFERAGLRLVVDCPPQSQPVYVDGDMWERIVLNLLSNALKFTFDGEIRVALREAGGLVELSVSDTGAGIPEAELEHIFERFHRVRNAKSRTHEGSGIGLSLVQELARLHGGEATVESIYGEGSTFCVSIPMGTAHLPQDRIGASRTLESTATGASPFVEEAMRWLRAGGESNASLDAKLPAAPIENRRVAGDAPTVLIADDNADMRDYMSRLLQEHWNVVAVADGSAALAEALRRPVDLVLTDVMMPGLDGFELLNALRGREETTTLPVILLSARAGEESLIEGFRAGADDYLVKPFSARELIARVQTHLALGTARREREEGIRDSERRYIELLESLGVAVYTTDAEGVLTYYNDAAVQLWGRAPQLGSDLWCGSWRMLYPDGRDMPLDECPMAVALKEDRIVRGEEAIAVRPDGTHVWIAPYPTPLHDGNRLTGAVNVLVDITERKQSVEALRASEERFRLAAEGARLGAWEWDLGDRVDWSETLEAIYGYERGAFPRSLSAFIGSVHPDDRERVMNGIQRALESRSDLELEERIVLPSGDVRWLHSRARLVIEGDRPVRMVGICMDITERKQAEVELAHAHAELISQTEILETVHRVGETVARELDLSRAVQAVTDAATKLTDAEFGSFFYNVTDQSGERYTVYTLSGADRSHFEAFPMPRATPIFKPTFDGEGPVRIADVHDDPRYGREAPYFGMPPGHLPVCSYLAVPVVARSGEVMGGLFFGHSSAGVFTETHEELAVGVAHWAALALENAHLYEDTLQAAENIRRQREDLYSMLMQSPLPIAVFTGRAFVCELANAHVIDALGHGDLVGRPLFESVPELAGRDFEKQMLSVLEADEPVVMTEQVVTLLRDGQVHDTYWNYAFTPLREHDGRVERVMVVAFEVTDEVLARKAMEEAIALKDQFLGLVSHELRTPISTVVANALILLRRGDRLTPEDRAQALEDIASEGDKLQRVIENLLMLTRIEASKGPDFRPIALHDVVSEQIETFTRQNPERQVVVMQGSDAIAVRGQSDLLAIVFSNLIGNAHKYSPPDAAIEVMLNPNDQGEVEVWVRDYGIGVDEAELPNLFVPFFRTGQARRYAAGMGLGLAVSKRIVDAHGGRIWASRRSEGGSDFVFTLPLVIDS